MKIPILLLTLIACRGIASAQNENTPPAASMQHPITIQHVSIASRRDFATTTSQFEKQLGVFDPEAARLLAAPNPELASIKTKIEAMAGSSGFMRFGNIQTFGFLLPFAGQPVGKANQYVIGNPLIALQMLQHDLRVGLYVPLRILVYENAQGLTQFEYDLPSSLLGQFQNENVNTVARMLDQKLESLIKSAAGR